MASEKVKRGKFLRADGLRACPFCRELFVDDEGEQCPECGIPVRALHELPPSADAERLLHEEAGGRPLAAPIAHAEPLPWKHMGRGRGPLLVIALLGIAAFYLPWAVQTAPHNVQYTAAELARKQSFFWSAFTAWLVLFPAVASRRTLLHMVGARPAIVMLSALPGVWCAFLLSRPTKLLIKGVPFEYHWGPGFWATMALSVAATFVALRFGGKLEDVTARRESSPGAVLH